MKKTVEKWVKSESSASIPKEKLIRVERNLEHNIELMSSITLFLEELLKLVTLLQIKHQQTLEPVFTSFNELYTVYKDHCKEENKPCNWWI